MDDAGIAPQSRKAVPGQYVAGSMATGITQYHQIEKMVVDN